MKISHHSTRTLQRTHGHRGNTMILVAGILVLLVILATAFITRTQGTAATSSAVHAASIRDDNMGKIAEDLAQQVSNALFSYPVNSNLLPAFFTNMGTADANAPRLTSLQNPHRYGIDLDLDGNGFPDHPYNFTPYYVYPWTNWPDESTGSIWPQGPGSPSGYTGIGEYNPPGDPGFGDARWLAWNEPLAVDFDTDGFVDSFKYWPHMTNISHPNNEWRIVRDISDVFDFDSDGYGGLLLDLRVPVEQWLISVQPNAVGASGQFGPFGDAIYPFDFIDKYRDWFSYDGYLSLYLDPLGMPTNLFNLKDLNANGVHLENGERPVDAFIPGTDRWNVERVLVDTDGDGYTDSFWFLAPTTIDRGIRQVVGVRIIDNCGMVNANVVSPFNPATTAGHTPADLVAFGPDADVQLTEFNNILRNGFFDIRHHQNEWQQPFLGWTPLFPVDPSIQYSDGNVQWDDALWPDFMREVGLVDQAGDAVPYFATEGGSNPRPLWLDLDRRRYFLAAGQQPFNPSFGVAPFSLADELELRMYYGSNYPWIVTRFEKSMNAATPGSGTDFAFLRSHPSFEETSPYLDQHFNGELLHDMRHRLTLYSAVRNEEMPPWNRWRWFANGLPDLDPVAQLAMLFTQDSDGDGVTDVVERFLAQSNRKIDLRAASPFVEVTSGSVQHPALSTPFASPTALGTGELLFHEFLPYHILSSMTDGEAASVGIGPTAPTPSFGYFGEYDPADASDTNRMRELAAGWTANILAWRDGDSLAPLFDDSSIGPLGQIGAIPLPDWGGLPVDDKTRMLGIEKQPFLLEAFIGHVYKTYEVPGDPVVGPGYVNSGDRLILQEVSGESQQSTVVVVQIANPFDEPILFYDAPADSSFDDPTHPEFEIEVFGNRVSLRALGEAIDSGVDFFLPPAREDYPSTMILYAIDEMFEGTTFEDQWRDFLDILEVEDGTDIHPPLALDTGGNVIGGTQIIDLLTPSLASDPDVEPWSTDRDHYDSFASNDEAIQIIRLDWAPSAVSPARVVIDRIDNEDDKTFVDSVLGLATNPPPVVGGGGGLTIPAQASPPVDFFPDPAWTPTDQTRTHWVQFVRATRAWGLDSTAESGTPGLNCGERYSLPFQRNPRYINSRMRVDRLPSTPPAIAGVDDVDGNSIADSLQYLIRFDPRYDQGGGGYADRFFSPPGSGARRGVSFNLADDPDAEGLSGDGLEEGMPWFTLTQLAPDGVLSDPIDVVATPPMGDEFARKPTYFDMNVACDDTDHFGTGWSYPDKGYYHSPFSLQMLQKDGDFEQVGELLNVWLFGHKLKFTESATTIGVYEYQETEKTFSEYMKELSEDSSQNHLAINRLYFGDEVIGAGDPTDVFDVKHAMPTLPPGVRVLDSFVCDGPGVNWDPSDPDPLVSVFENRIFGNAAGFTGKPTHGMPNANTASVEVLRALPHWYKLVHRKFDDTALNSVSTRSAIAEALISYRERFNNVDPNNPQMVPLIPGLDWYSGYGYLEDGVTPKAGPNYEDRSALMSEFTGTRAERGLASPAEALMLVEEAPVPDFSPGPNPAIPDFLLFDLAWQSGFAGANVFFGATDQLSPASDGVYGAPLSTDVSNTQDDGLYYDWTLGQWISEQHPYLGDGVASDSEERALLYAGASNLLTTRSDTFTVYFKVRSFRQNPVTGRWDATDPEYIVDESRYVMLVDRSEVNHPSQKPRILYLEKLPN